MHAKQKGSFGESIAAATLMKLGHCVFTELGDLSKIDLISEKNKVLLRYQVKCITPKDGRLQLNLKKSGPGYKFSYEDSQFDYFLVVNIETSKVYAINSSILNTNKHMFNLRLTKPKNGQVSGVNIAEDYEVEKVLPL